MARTWTRRELLRTTSAATAGLAAASWARGAAAQAPNDKVLVGVIGAGGQGVADMKHFMRLPDVEIVALADVDRGRLDATAVEVEKKYGRKPQTFKDFRRLLDVQEINALILATPDHWHALPFVLACEAGKDIYCEKPISHNIVEGRAMVTAALKHKRVIQVGTQQRSGAHFQKAIELVRSGALGRVLETHTWNCENDAGLGRPPDGNPPPEVDYDFWLGPAPRRPFNPNRFHFNWRWYFDYAGGKMADWNVHLQDIVHLAMDAWSPKSVVMFGQIALAAEDDRDTPDTIKAVYEYDSAQGPFTQSYTHRRTNAFSQDGNREHAGHGLLFCGRKANLFVDRKGWMLIPEKGQGESQHGGGSEQNPPHARNFLDCVKSRAKPVSDIESMHKTTLACHLGNIAYRVGRRIYWDAVKERCYRDAELKAADDEANGYLGREYRAPWKLPTP